MCLWSVRCAVSKASNETLFLVVDPRAPHRVSLALLRGRSAQFFIFSIRAEFSGLFTARRGVIIVIVAAPSRAAPHRAVQNTTETIAVPAARPTGCSVFSERLCFRFGRPSVRPLLETVVTSVNDSLDAGKVRVD